MTYKQLVLVEFDNSGAFVERFTSKRKITLARIARFIEKRDDANWERDSVTLIDESEETSID